MTGKLNSYGPSADPEKNDEQQEVPRGLSWIGSTLSSKSQVSESTGPFQPKKEDEKKEFLEEGDPLTPVEQVREIVERIKSRKIPIRVDLGCGQTAPAGFIGADRFQLPGVMVVADINQKLPFDDDSVDVLQACHSLEHADDLAFTMKEVYRICRHKAQVCIVAPYQGTSLNLANFYHKNMWNEHTPRFFTAAPKTLIPKEEYDFPYSGDYGLAHSDNSLAPFDFRCIRMEFFYFPEYVDLPDEEQRQLRQKGLNVCDQIMYHLLVVKEDMPHEQLEEEVKNLQLHTPPAVQVRRAHEQARRQEAEFARVREELGRHESLLEESLNEKEKTEERLREVEETLQWRRSTEKPLSITAQIYSEPDDRGERLPVTLYEAAADGKAGCSPERPLPEGWQEGHNADLDAIFWSSSRGAVSPLTVPMEGLGFKLRFLGTTESGRVKVVIGRWEKMLDLFSDKPGGEWKVIKFSRPEVERDWFEGLLDDLGQEKHQLVQDLDNTRRQLQDVTEELHRIQTISQEKSDQLQQALSQAEQNFEQLEIQADEERSALNANIEALQQKVEQNRQELEKSRQEVERLVNELESSRHELENTSGKAGLLENELSQARTELEKATSRANQLEEETTQWRQRAEADTARITELEEKAGRFGQERDAFESKLIESRNALSDEKEEAERLKEDLKALDEDRQRMRTEIEHLGEIRDEKEAVIQHLEQDLKQRRQWEQPLPVAVKIQPEAISQSGPVKTVALYQASTDLQPECEPAKDLPEGWREGYNESADSRYWICSSAASKPLVIPMNGLEFELRFLALESSGPTVVTVGYWKKEIDLYSTSPGGEWRTVKFSRGEVERDWYRYLLDEKEQSHAEVVENLQGEMDAFQAQKQEEIQLLQTQVEALNAQLTQAREKQDHDNRVQEEMQAALDSRRQEMDQLNASLAEVEQARTEWRQKFEEVSEQLNQSKLTEQKLRSLVETLQKEQQELEKARQSAGDNVRQLEERIQNLMEERDALVDSLESRGAELSAARQELEKINTRLGEVEKGRTELNRKQSSLEEENSKIRQQLKSTEQTLATRDSEIHEVRTVLESKVNQLTDFGLELEQAKTSRVELQKELESIRQSEQGLQEKVKSLEEEKMRSRHRLEILEAYLERYRQNRPKGMGRMFENRIDLRAEVSPNFRGLFEASPKLSGSLNDYVLQLTEDLRSMDYVSYWIECPKDSWCGISLSFFRERSTGRGQAGVEVVLDGQDIIRQSIVSYDEILDTAPVVFKFDAIPDSRQGRFEIRVFAQPGSESGIRLFEWQLRKPKLVGREENRPFCELHFAESS